MDNCKLILDTCTYFRLSLLFDDILQISFVIGNVNYIFVTHENIIDEYNRQPRLKLKYQEPPKFCSPRKDKLIKVRPKDLQKFDDYLAYIDYTEYFNSNNNNLSNIDKKCIGLQLLNGDSTILVSDDFLLIRIAKESGAKVKTGREVIELMFQNNILSEIEIRQFIKKLNENEDFIEDYAKLRQI